MYADEVYSPGLDKSVEYALEDLERRVKVLEEEKETLLIKTTATVILFKESGKYYTEEKWRIPEDTIGPYDMAKSPDFRRIGKGAVLVESQEPWGYPHLFPSP